MKIGEVASRSGLEASAIRYYEQAGLLPKPSRVSGRRIYDSGILHRIVFIQFAREAGFTIREIRVLSDAFRPAQPLSAKLQRLAVQKIGEVERFIVQAQLMKKLLQGALHCQCMDVTECGKKIQAIRKPKGESGCGSLPCVPSKCGSGGQE